MRTDRADMGGKAALTLAMAIYAALAVMAYSASDVYPVVARETGICFPPPELWGLPPLMSLLLNIGLIALCALAMVVINRRFNFIPTPTVIYASVFMLMAGANPQLSMALNSSTLLAVANVVAIRLLFNQYGRTRPDASVLFTIGTLFSLGSMVHFAFIFFLVAYALAAVLLKTMQGRQLMALLIGIVAPYWIILGLGIVQPQELRIPVPSAVWQAVLPGPELLWLIISVIVTAFWGLMAGLRNAFTLFTASTAVRAFNYSLALPAISCLVLMLIDWENFSVYFLTVCLFTALQAGYLVASGRRRTGSIIYWLVAPVYIFFALMSIYG